MGCWNPVEGGSHLARLGVQGPLGLMRGQRAPAASQTPACQAAADCRRTSTTLYWALLAGKEQDRKTERSWCGESFPPCTAMDPLLPSKHRSPVSVGGSLIHALRPIRAPQSQFPAVSKPYKKLNLLLGEDLSFEEPQRQLVKGAG